jgi:hypothetical protein
MPKNAAMNGRGKKRKRGSTKQGDDAAGPTSVKPGNKVSYIYLLITIFDDNEQNPQTTIMKTSRKEEAVCNTRLYATTSTPTKTSPSASRGHKPSPNHNHRAAPPSGMSIRPSIPVLSSSSSPSSSSHAPYAAEERQKSKQRFTAMVLFSVNQPDEVNDTVMTKWRASRGLLNRVNEGMLLARANNMISFVSEELLTGELAIPEVNDVYKHQRPLRERFGLC